MIGRRTPKARRAVPQDKPSTDSTEMKVAQPSCQDSPGIAPPHRPTQARLQTFFLRQFARSGSLADAAARAGIATRTVQRWRLANPAFARRYAAVLEARVEMLEDLAMRRALGADRRPVFHRGKQVATVERHNDALLMRMLARFDRLRERRAEQPRGKAPPYDPAADDIRLLDEAGEKMRVLARQEFALERRMLQESEERMSNLSPSRRQSAVPGVGQ